MRQVRQAVRPIETVEAANGRFDDGQPGDELLRVVLGRLVVVEGVDHLTGEIGAQMIGLRFEESVKDLEAGRSDELREQETIQMDSSGRGSIDGRRLRSL